MRQHRGGPSSRALASPSVSLTGRIRRLVDDIHNGNLMEASLHAGVPYATLRDIHAGKVRWLAAKTVERLASVYSLPYEWFVGVENDDGTVPSAGWVVTIPSEKPEVDSTPELGQRLMIPYAAWPLVHVLVQLEQRLRDMNPSPARPIIGTLSEPRAIRARIAAFILQPLLAARAMTTSSPRLDLGASADPTGIEMLRDLGLFWQRALGPLLNPSASGSLAAGL
jgi:hypothetical protein